jgi:hypothetical protein
VLAPAAPSSAPPAAPKQSAPEPAQDSGNPFNFDVSAPPNAPASAKKDQARERAAPPKVSDEPIYTFDRKKEAADSIMSEGHDSEDEVFSSQTGSKAPVPVLPDPHPKPHTSHALADSGSPILELPPSEVPTLELRKPVDIVPPPAPSGTLLVPPTGPAPSVAAAPTPATHSNPFAFDPSGTHSTLAERQATLPESVPVPIPIEESSDEVATSRTTRGSRERDPTDPGTKFKRLALILAAYSLVVTALAVYGLFFKPTEKLDPGHPLSTIPDSFGEFDPASRKRVTQIKMPLDGELPANQRTSLGGKIEIGQLAIEPVLVEKRPLKIIREGKKAGDVVVRPQGNSALVLHLKVTNTSTDTPIFPLDPAFTRAAKSDDQPATRLLMGKRTLYGGAISWPFGERIKREYEEQQARDFESLAPGQTREYIVFTNEDSTLTSQIKKLTEPLLWRIQVRRGVVPLKGKDVPVTAIIGVEFKASDVKNLD